jgi:hypothetical protein
MADFVFTSATGVAVEKVNDAAANLGVMLLKVAEADGTLRDRTTLAAILAAANTQADFTNYARKTAITGTVTVDTANNRSDIDMPDQTWVAAGGASNNTLVKAIIYYEDAAADATRIPLVGLDFAVTTDGTDLTMQLNASGFYRAAAA